MKFLWVQEVVKSKKVELRKICGSRNPADVLTKPKSLADVGDKLRFVGVDVQRRLGRVHGSGAGGF